MIRPSEEDYEVLGSPLTLEILKVGERATITVEEAAQVMGMKRTATYDAVRRGQLPSLRLGRRLFIPVPALLRLLDGNSYPDPSQGGPAPNDC